VQIIGPGQVADLHFINSGWFHSAPFREIHKKKSAAQYAADQYDLP
jgi:hypothetical protein